MYSGNYYMIEQDDLNSTSNLPDFATGYLQISPITGTLECYKKPPGLVSPIQTDLKPGICAIVNYIDTEEDEVWLLYDDGVTQEETQLTTIPV